MFGVQSAHPIAGPTRLVFADDASHFVKSGLFEGLFVEWRCTGQQFIQQHAQRIDVTASVDIQTAHLGLLGTHVHRRADQLAVSRVDRLVGQLMMQRFGDAKVDDFGIIRSPEDVTITFDGFRSRWMIPF